MEAIKKVMKNSSFNETFFVRPGLEALSGAALDRAKKKKAQTINVHLSKLLSVARHPDVITATIRGDTYVHRALFQRNGMRWNKESMSWKGEWECTENYSDDDDDGGEGAGKDDKASRLAKGPLGQLIRILKKLEALEEPNSDAEHSASSKEPDRETRANRAELEGEKEKEFESSPELPTRPQSEKTEKPSLIEEKPPASNSPSRRHHADRSPEEISNNNNNNSIAASSQSSSNNVCIGGGGSMEVRVNVSFSPPPPPPLVHQSPQPSQPPVPGAPVKAQRKLRLSIERPHVRRAMDFSNAIVIDDDEGDRKRDENDRAGAHGGPPRRIPLEEMRQSLEEALAKAHEESKRAEERISARLGGRALIDSIMSMSESRRADGSDDEDEEESRDEFEERDEAAAAAESERGEDRQLAMAPSSEGAHDQVLEEAIRLSKESFEREENLRKLIAEQKKKLSQATEDRGDGGKRSAEEAELDRIHLESDSPTSRSPKIAKIEPTKALVEEKCCVCFEVRQRTVCIPCGHICMCEPCTKALFLTKKECPICRKRATRYMNVFPV